MSIRNDDMKWAFQDGYTRACVRHPERPTGQDMEKDWQKFKAAHPGLFSPDRRKM